MTRRSLLSIGVIAACGIAALALRGGSAQTPPSARPSPEEAILAALPYELQPSDVPPGYQLVTEGAVSPSELAYTIGNDPDESHQILADLQRRGLQVEVSQSLLPGRNIPIRLFTYQILLFANQPMASAGLHDSLDVSESDTQTVDNPPLPVRLGDESGAVHVVITSPDSNNEQHEQIVWRRGRVVLSVQMITLDSTETLDQAVPFAQIADGRAATLSPPAPAAQAALPVVGDESYRVDAMYALFPRLPSPSQAPVGVRLDGATVINNADLMLQPADPMTEFTRLTRTWRRIVGVLVRFTTLQDQDGEILRAADTLSADADGARTMMLDPEFARSSLIDFVHLPDAGSFSMFALPRPLGDDGRMYHASMTSDLGVPLDVWVAVWVRGRVVLTVAGSAPAGTLTAQNVADFAAVSDGRFNRGALPDVLMSPLPSITLPPSTPTPGPIVGR